MKRKIYDALLTWKANDSSRTALLIDGARRVGKSYIAEEFAKKEYKSYILIDFNKVNKEVKSLFENYLDNLDNFPEIAIPLAQKIVQYPFDLSAFRYIFDDSSFPNWITNSYNKLLANVEGGLVFSKDGDAIWQCRNCGHIVVGKDAPNVCPVCAHPQSFFEINKENY
mgnify:CR=1 FL=1